MARLLTLVLCLTSLASAAADRERPSRAALQRVLERHGRSVVNVQGPRRAGPGVFIGAAGQVLTSVAPVGLGFTGLNATTVEHEGKTLPARVVLASEDLQVAVLAAPEGTYPAAPVKLLKDGASLAGQWLVGVVPATKGQPARPVPAQARAAPAPFYDVALALPAGTPVFDAEGRLVAVVVKQLRRGCRVLPLGAVKVELAAMDTP
ncbi:serine protease [Comamonas sp. JC664]|uniref:MXAN_2756 family trypsin-like serine endoprotease n=1 Tax=Comamonas sp. JC664 TaxID=2801917 RepID=UPI00174E417A|nr:serine protease [Comamonas sp. JC664]MBL0693598.1 trypsin-like peptidase domain-containing protein [Comamonas sp. JC664]GHG73412.1 hypothetical protein GCM10012319_20210 [Comamonas sp. KCTC 72670]